MSAMLTKGHDDKVAAEQWRSIGDCIPAGADAQPSNEHGTSMESGVDALVCTHGLRLGVVDHDARGLHCRTKGLERVPVGDTSERSVEAC